MNFVKILDNDIFNIKFLTGKTDNKKEILNNLRNGKIELLIGTHALFQKNRI